MLDPAILDTCMAPLQIINSPEGKPEKIDRRVSVAPMMDWTDGEKTIFSINWLGPAQHACLLYVSSILRNGNLLMLGFRPIHVF